MGIFYKFKHKDDNHRNGTSLEDCIVKMFASAGMEPYRDGNKFSAVVLGKHYAFIVTISCMEGNRLLIYVRFPIPVREKSRMKKQRICKLNMQVEIWRQSNIRIGIMNFWMMSPT